MWKAREPVDGRREEHTMENKTFSPNLSVPDDHYTQSLALSFYGLSTFEQSVKSPSQNQ